MEKALRLRINPKENTLRRPTKWTNEEGHYYVGSAGGGPLKEINN